MKISAKFTPGKKNANMIRALEQVSQAGNFTQGIGWFEDQLYPDGTKIVEVAKLQEYGGVNESGHRIPARPFMRPAKRRGRSEWRNDIKKGIKKGSGTLPFCLNGKIRFHRQHSV